jgi:hypothetical protein
VFLLKEAEIVTDLCLLTLVVPPPPGGGGGGGGALPGRAHKVKAYQGSLYGSPAGYHLTIFKHWVQAVGSPDGFSPEDRLPNPQKNESFTTT